MTDAVFKEENDLHHDMDKSELGRIAETETHVESSDFFEALCEASHHINRKERIKEVIEVTVVRGWGNES